MQSQYPLSITFDVERKPLSTNEMYGVHPVTKRLYVKRDAEDFKNAVNQSAYVMARYAGWPKPECVRQVEISIVVLNTKHDASAADKLVCDGLEGVLYANDKVAHPRHNDIGCDTSKIPRVKVTVNLLAYDDGGQMYVRTPEAREFQLA